MNIISCNLRPWLTLKKDSLTPIWPNSKDPSFVLRYFASAGQTNVFRLDEAKPSTTLRIDSGVSSDFHLHFSPHCLFVARPESL